jgi:hypothetical protein
LKPGAHERAMLPIVLDEPREENHPGLPLVLRSCCDAMERAGERNAELPRDIAESVCAIRRVCRGAASVQGIPGSALATTPAP